VFLKQMTARKTNQNVENIPHANNELPLSILAMNEFVFNRI